ncbi:PspC domain-containing protein [Actinoplanes teichomyceticus]|uniref:Phage shock protein C (PspC) family protein n=1 Tax=Actinoplanes teichomyceticus TaxID=1867 RepID=A0A561VLY1_ACTTI|nr:PspC domain-containing protein [Actinoplanes teichomyceticus]TWG12634.1 phage shock protein C (PspC) family protein [Actinoplanes teichomyceticus]GIF14004.1 hypothetical protein Ate01nite_40360 [Actinoplanes teichomyceticus]
MTTPSIPTPPVFPARTLRRSRADRVIGGVCGGLGRHFEVDPLLLRIVAAALALASGVGLLAYVVAWVLIPDDIDEPARPRLSLGLVSWYLALALVVLGGVLLLRLAVPWLPVGLFWPMLVVLAGILVLTSIYERKP